MTWCFVSAGNLAMQGSSNLSTLACVWTLHTNHLYSYSSIWTPSSHFLPCLTADASTSGNTTCLRPPLGKAERLRRRIGSCRVYFKSLATILIELSGPDYPKSLQGDRLVGCHQYTDWWQDLVQSFLILFTNSRHWSKHWHPQLHIRVWIHARHDVTFRQPYLQLQVRICVTQSGDEVGIRLIKLIQSIW